MQALSAQRCALLVVDWQERLEPVMAAGVERRRKARVAIEGASALGIPVLATEQYPQGLGPTVAEIRALLPGPPVEKRAFSACAEPMFLDALRATGRTEVLVLGMEAHICVFQTVRDLCSGGWRAVVLRDAVTSRTEEDRACGLALCEQAGAAVHTVESALFDLLGRAEGPAFKAISRLVR